MINIFKSKLPYKESKTNPHEIAINCPFCNDSKYHAGLNFKINAYHCFKCNASGRISKLAKKLFNIDYENVFKENVSIDVKSIVSIDKQPTLLPEGFISLADNLNSYYNKYHDYLFNRRISLMQIKYYNIGVCLNKYKGYIFIPIYDINNNQVYWTTRSINPKAELKSILPKVEHGYYIKSDCLFNINNAINFDEIIICEGVFNAITMGRNAVAILGKYLSANQLNIVKKFKRIIIALDNDAVKDAYHMADNLLKYCETIFIVKYPDNRDINELYIDDELHKIRYIPYKGLHIL